MQRAELFCLAIKAKPTLKAEAYKQCSAARPLSLLRTALLSCSVQCSRRPRAAKRSRYEIRSSDRSELPTDAKVEAVAFKAKAMLRQVK